MHPAHRGKCCGWTGPFYGLSHASGRRIAQLANDDRVNQRLSEALKATHPEIEWRRIAAFRNVLLHAYLGIDLERIWEVIERDVPPLKQAILAMLEQQE